MSKKLTTDTFILKSNELHKNKYDYSKVDYKGSKIKLRIICSKHGEFWQRPNEHLSGRGCFECGRTKRPKTTYKITTDSFIEKSHKIHKNYYTYPNLIYKGTHEKVCIVCPLHGKFWQQPNSHLNGRGCFECGRTKRTLTNPNKITTNEFIKRSEKLHGKKYDYSKVNYIDSKTKVCIICKEHGKFWQLPFVHMNNHGCPSCGNVKRLTKKFVLIKANGIHKNKYHYILDDFKNKRSIIKIICPDHGLFNQIVSSHLSGKGCSKCANNIIKTIEEFIKDVEKIHGKKYDYSKVDYKNNNTKVCIICKDHGEFWQKPIDHLHGMGCPFCNKIGIFREKYFQQNPIMKKKNSILYFLDFGKFIKIGITTKPKVSWRFGKNKFKYEILKEVKMKLYKSWSIEQFILKKYFKFRTIPKVLVGNGSTECFKNLNWLVEKIKKDIDMQKEICYT